MLFWLSYDHERSVGGVSDSDRFASPTIPVAWRVNVRIAHLRIAHWGAILRWAILSLSVIRIAHPNYYFFMNCL